MALRTRGNLVSFLRHSDDEPSDIIVMPHGGNQPDGQYNSLTHPNEVASSGRMPVLRSDDKVRRGFSLSQFANIWIYAHGDSSGNLIYTDRLSKGLQVSKPGDRNLDAGGTITPVMVLNVLMDFDLDEDFEGNIIVWTCFSGRLGGFAETFAHCLQTKGLGKIPVYGVKYATGPHCLFFNGGPTDAEVGMSIYKSGGLTANPHLLRLALDSKDKAIQRHGQATYAAVEDLREIVAGVSMQK